MTFIFLWIIYIIFNSSITKILSQTIHKISLNHFYNAFKIEIEFEEQHTILQIHLDMDTPYSYFTDSFYNKSLGGKKNSTQEITFKCNDYLTDQYTHAFSFTFTSFACWIPEFYFLVFPKNTKDSIIYSSLSLSKRFWKDVKNFSFIELLYEHKQIEKRTFAFITLPYHKSVLYIGGVDNDVLDVYQNKLVFNSDSRSIYRWGWKLNKINDFVNEYFSYFDCAVEYILVPPSFMEYLNKTFWNDYFNKDKCAFDSNNNIICDYEIRYKFPGFSILFEGYEFYISGSDLLDHYLYKLKWLVKENTQNEWVFGVVFLSKFNMEFSYEDETITFYSLNDYVYRGFTEQKETPTWEVILLSVVLMGLCFGIAVNWVHVLQKRN